MSTFSDDNIPDFSPNAPSPRPLFSASVVRGVWERTKRLPGFETFAVDDSGAMINRFDYGRRSEYGWEIEPIDARRSHNSVDPIELHAVHWRNLRSGGDEKS